MRGDTERDRRHLIKAAARLFENSPTPVNLAEIAKHAEPLRQTAEELGLGDLGDEALYLWNALIGRAAGR